MTVEVRDLTVARDGRIVLDQVSLKVAAGERLVIIGQNGAGKSTLLRCLVGLEPAATGQIRIAGIACTSEAQFRRSRLRTGFLFQDSDDQLFCPTVIEDVAFGPANQGHDPRAARALAVEALAELGLSHLAERSVHRLSGGEKRLVCLAGVLAMTPDLLCLDEPTTGLDDVAETRLIARLDGFPGAMIVVSHDPTLAVRLSARVRRLHDGRLEPVIRG